MIDGPESINPQEAISGEGEQSIQNLINILNQQIEIAQSSEKEPGETQVREQINIILIQAMESLSNKKFQACVSSLTDASDYAYQQSSIPGFEEFESISDQIDSVIETVKNLSPSS